MARPVWSGSGIARQSRRVKKWSGGVCPVKLSRGVAVEVRYFPARRGKEVNAGQSRNGTARLVGLSQRKAVGEG